MTTVHYPKITQYKFSDIEPGAFFIKGGNLYLKLTKEAFHVDIWNSYQLYNTWDFMKNIMLYTDCDESIAKVDAEIMLSYPEFKK